jgi:hypothetical protein
VILPVFAFLVLLVAVARGGDIRQLAHVRLRFGWVPLIALLLQVVIFSSAWDNSRFATLTPILYVTSMLLLAVVISLNWRLPGFALIGVGVLSNALVIALNGGRMPASLGAVTAAGLQDVAIKAGAVGSAANSILIDPQTRLPFLADVFAIPRWVPLANVLSVGDILIAIGAVWFFFGVVRRPHKDAAE